MNITTTRRLRTDAWAAPVAEVERAIERFESDPADGHACQVAFFEIARDPQLHVNVTHTFQTVEVSGWAGPANRPEGFVHNRRFGDPAARHIVRHIRDMVFAAPM